MNLFKKKSFLSICFSLLTLLGVIVFYVTTILKDDLIRDEFQNQKKISKTIEQSLNLFFRTLVFITESTASNKAFDYERNLQYDLIRYNEITKLDMLKGFNVLENKNNHSELWQVYKGLPDFYSGKAVGTERREVARNILANNPELHYVFEMDINGDLVFLEPYTTQVGITSFNYGFRDYLKLSKYYKKTVISEGYLSHDKAKTQILTVASPIFDKKGEIKRVFAVSISSKAIKDKIFLALKDTIEGLDDGHLILVDRHGHTIASSSPGMIYSPMVNNISDESDIGNIRNLRLFENIKWNDDTFEKGNLWERATKSWDTLSLNESYSDIFDFKASKQIGTLYPISVLNNEKLWGIIVTSSAAKIDSRINSILTSSILLWLLISVITLTITANLISRNERLENKLNLDRKAFENLSAQVAHDIRSPASVIKRILERENLTFEDSVQLKALTKRIIDISNQILGLKINIEESSRPISMIVTGIVNEKRLQFENFPKVQIISEIKIKNDLKTSFPDFELSRVLSNLINNSFEALLDFEGVIRISVSREGNFIQFALSDNGVGISEVNLAKISTGNTSKKAGKGIGLSSSREKVINSGGEFKIESKLGVGTTITFSIPVLAAIKSSSIVLLDDDRYVRLNWEREFNEAGLDLRCFDNPENLRNHLKEFSRETTFILDTCDFSTEFFSLLDELKKLNWNKVFIYSGYDQSSLKDKNVGKIAILPKDYNLVDLLH